MAQVSVNPFARWFTPERVLALIIPFGLTLFLFSARAELPEDRAFLGFVHVDQPVYYSAARELFENGNGVFYASQYSNLSDSPRIYTSFAFMLIGWLWKLGLSFTFIDYAIRAIAGGVFFLLIVELFRASFASRFSVFIGSMAAMLCGGLAWAAALFRVGYDAWLVDLPWGELVRHFGEMFFDSFREAEGGYGEWQVTPFRSLLYAPETIYHALAFAAAVALLRGRYAFAHGFIFLTWWSHPFNGLEIGAIAFAFFAVEFALRTPRGGRHLAISAGINAVFIGYYLLLLPQFPEHAVTARQMREFANPMLLSMIVPAVGAFALLPLFGMVHLGFSNAFRAERPVRLFTVWLLVVATLVFHDRLLVFTRPFQPMHFHRGYLFIPLVYFSVRALERLRARAPRAMFACAALLVLFHLPDNFIALSRLRPALHDSRSYSIAARDLELLRAIDAIEPAQTIYTSPRARHLDYYIPLLTHHRALLPHEFNTPDFAEKQRLARSLQDEFSVELVKELNITALVLDQESFGRFARSVEPNVWETALEINERVLVLFNAPER